MILISKKRIQIITMCILVSLFAFSFKVAGPKNELDKDSNIVETTSTPVSGKTVVLDAGHGKPDERIL